MPYDYKEYRSLLFSEEGIEKILKIYAKSRELFERAGACTYSKLTESIGGDTWFALACVDYLVETERLRRVDPDTMTQHQVYTLPAWELMGV